MNYDFDRIQDHRANGGIRWNEIPGRTDYLGMGTADLDYDCPPSVREDLLKVAEANCYNYRFRPEEYYESVIGFLKRRFGQTIEKDWIFNVPGTLASVRFAVRCFTKPGDKVLMHNPLFEPLKLTITSSGCEVVYSNLVLKDGRYEIDWEDFENKIRTEKPAVFMLCSPHNPTGRIFTREELTRMVEICAENDVKVISDEVHFLVNFDGKKHVCILDACEKAKDICVQIFSLSKGFNLMSLPNAFVVIADPAMRKKYADFGTAHAFQYAYNLFAFAAAKAVTDGRADQWLDDMTAYLQENRDIFAEECKRRNLPITPIVPEASFVYWIDCRDCGIPAEELGSAFLERAGIALNNGTHHGSEGAGFVRLNFAVTREVLYEALDRLEKMFAK